jgi:hypothetical protein
MEKTIRIPPPNIKDLEVMIKNIKGASLFVLNQEPEGLKHYTSPGRFKESLVELATNKANDGLYSRRKDIRRGIWVMSDSKSILGEDLITLKCGTPKPYYESTGLVLTYAEFDTWEAKLRVRFNADLFTVEEVVTLVLLSGEPHHGYPRIPSGGFCIAEQPAPTVREIRFGKTK